MLTIEQIVDIARRYYRERFDQEIRGGCSEELVNELRSRICEKYGYELPDGYCQLLRLADGFGHDGYGIYASRPIFENPGDEWPAKDGLVEANEGFEVDGVAYPGILQMGYGDDTFFGVDMRTGIFHRYDIYGRPLKDFQTFDEMFGYMYERRFDV